MNNMRNENQGKRPDQIGASELFTGIAFIGLILTFIYLIIFKK